MSLITRNAKEYASMTAECHIIYLSGPFGIFCLYVTISYLRAQTIETSSLPSRFLAAPVQANRDFFWHAHCIFHFNCKYFPQYTRELLECLLGISPSLREQLRLIDLFPLKLK